MHDALFLPRELFSPAPPAPVAAVPVRANRVAAARFDSGEAVAADLMEGVGSLAERPGTPRDRRRKPRRAGEIGVDLHLGDREG